MRPLSTLATLATLATIATLAAFGCDDAQQPGVDLGAPRRVDARPADAAAADARVDAAAVDAAVDASPDAAPDAGPPDLGPPTPLPLGPAAVQIIGPALATDIDAAWVPGDGSLVFDSSDVDFTRSRLFGAAASDGGFAAPVALDGLSDRALVAGPSVIEFRGETWLYFVDSPGLDGVEVGIKRARWAAGRWVDVEAVRPIPETWILSWPRFVALDDGVGLAWRDWNSAPHFARSADGLRFDAPVRIADAGALATVGRFADGTLVYTWQEESAARPFVAYYSLSTDGGATWRPKAEVTDASGNVHDTAPVERRDGTIDLYYIYPASARGFVLFRRHLTADGRLGPEERVTADALGEPSKPGGARLPDGRLLLWWAEISARDLVQGWPTEQRIVVTRIQGDAPSAEPMQ